MNSLPNEAIDIEMEPEFHETEETKPNESSQTGSDVCVTIHSNDPSSLHTQTSAVEDLVPAAMNSEISSIIQVICRIALERLRSVRIGDSSTSSPIIIDDTSNFFEAGGTSDDVVFMVSQLRTELAFDNVSAADIFQNPTPKQLAVVIQKRMRGMDSEEKEIEEDNAEEAGDHIVDGEEARFSAQLSRTASHVRFEPPSKLHDPNNTVPPTSSTIRTFRASSSFHTSKFHTSREPSVRLWRSSNKPISPQNAGAGGTALPSEGETFTRFQIPSWWKYVQLFYMLLMWTTFGGSLAVAYAITDFITTDTDQFLGSLYLMLCVRTCVFSVLVAVSLVLMIKVWKVVWDSLCGGPIVAGVVESSSWLHRSREWFLSTYWDVMGVILSPLHGTPLMSVLLRFLGAHIGSDVDVYSNGFDLAAIHLVHIGDDAFIGHSASISTLSVDRRRGTIIGMVTIIGSECVVEEQAEIGTGAVLGERCLVKPLSVVSGQSPSCVRWSAREGVYDESLERKPSTVLSSPPPRRTLFQHLFLLVFILCVGVASLQPAVFVQWIYWNNETVQTQLVDPNRDRQPATWFFHEHMPILRFALFPAWILIWSVWGCIASIILIRLTASVAHLLCPLTQQPCSDATFLHPGSDLSVANSGCRVPLHSWQFLLWSWCRQTISSLHPYTAVLMPMSLLHFYYRACGATIHHKSLIIGPPSAMRMPHHLLTVERDAMITNGPVLGAMEVDVQTRCVKMGPITVREGSLIANHAILHPCIDIPAHSTVAPMAIVSPATFQTDIEQSASQSKSMQSKSNLLSPTPLKSNLGNKSTNASPIHAKTDEVRVGMRPLFIGAPASISQFRPNLSESVGLRSLQDDKESFRLWWPLVHLCGLCIVIFWAAIWSICFLPGMLFIDALHAPLGRNTSLSLLLLVPVAYLIIVCCVLLAFIAVKWIVLGRYESGKKGHFRSIWFMKYIMSHVAGTRSPLSLNFIAPYMAGTEWYVMYIRCLGAKIGKNGYFGDFTILSDYDLHDIGDDVVMTAGANPFCHYFDRGLMSFDRITTGNDVTVSGSAHVLPGVSLGAGSYIESRTVIMRGETIPPGTRWAGSPAKCLTVRHPAASMPTPPRSIPSITGSASSVAAMSESIRSFLFPFEASPKPSAPQSTNVPPAHTLIDRLSSEGSSTCSSSSSSVAPPPASIPASSSVSINMTAEEAGALAHRLSVSLLPVDIGTSALGCWDMLPDPVTGHRDSILDLIYHHVKTQPWSPCMTWVNEKGHDEMTLTYQQFWDAALAVATQITSKLAGLKSPSKKSHSDTVGAPLPQFPPQVDVGSLGIDRPRVILCYAFDLNFIVGFIGTLLAGAIAVPVYTPDPSSIKRSLTKLNAIVKACGAQLALTNTTFNRFRVVSSIITSGSDVNSAWPASLQWIVTDCAPKKNRKLQWTFENTPAFGKIEPNHILFLQFTSGSTGTPKGVCISARNVFHNCYGIHRDFLRAHKGRPMIMCSWLPPFHGQLSATSTTYGKSLLNFPFIHVLVACLLVIYCIEILEQISV